MNSFMKGVLVGVGIGLLVAPMKGEEMRRMLGQRLGELRGYLPENVQLDQLGQYTQQVSDRVAQTAGNLKGYAQQAASTMRNTAGSLSSIGKNAASDVKQTGQDVADTTRRAANSTTQS
ncbi:MAG TPA: YtxH domain-containing protein [Ktedonobacteraceae bacterium]|jgi:gas vesicle protein|nr:YtxH domain-containing protein [Ktedonobacteraceae bacterium]